MQPKFIFFEISRLISHVKHDFRPNFNEFSENRRYCHLRILFCYCPQARTSSRRRGGAELLRYLEAFARLFDLHRLVWFETEVVRIRREPGSGWAVALMKLGEKGSGEEEVYNAVVVCIGHYMEPRIATIPGKFRRHTGRGSVGSASQERSWRRSDCDSRRVQSITMAAMPSPRSPGREAVGWVSEVLPAATR
jgi:hypothetical protein